MDSKIIYKELSYKIVGALFEVYNELGYGLQEKYYQKAIAKMLSNNGISFQEQVPYKIAIKGVEVGRYYLDFLIDDKIVLEIKRGRHYSRRNIEQVKGYLHVTKKQLAILANFMPDGVKTLRIPNIEKDIG